MSMNMLRFFVVFSLIFLISGAERTTSFQKKMKRARKTAVFYHLCTVKTCKKCTRVNESERFFKACKILYTLPNCCQGFSLYQMHLASNLF